MKTIKQALALAKKEISASPTPDLDALVLLAFLLKQTKGHVLANLNEKLNEDKINNFLDLILRRQQGEPVAYLTGHKEFYGLDFIVTPNVLIPRPETESLIEAVLDYIRNFLSRHEAQKQQPSLLPTSYSLPPARLDLADVGTGSGCIGITLAKRLPNAKIWAFENSKKALEVAKKNYINLLLGKSSETSPRASLGRRINYPSSEVEKYNNKNINFVQNDLLSGVRQKFDIICANLPYLTEAEYKKSTSVILATPTLRRRRPESACPSKPWRSGDSRPVSPSASRGGQARMTPLSGSSYSIKFEPKTALVGGRDGLDYYRKLIPQLRYTLKSNGAFFCEIGSATQAKKISELIKKYFPSASISIKKDLAGLDRVVIAQI